jgi:hypothetical protein
MNRKQPTTKRIQSKEKFGYCRKGGINSEENEIFEGDDDDEDSL